MKKNIYAGFLIFIFALLVTLVVRRSGMTDDSVRSEFVPSSGQAAASPQRSSQAVAPGAEATEKDQENTVGAYSPEMERLVAGIHAGHQVMVKVGDDERNYLFRPKRITADGFKISAGLNSEHPAAYEVFEGRQVSVDGTLVQMAKLAVVNDTLSMAYTTESGDFLIERNKDGKWVSRTLLSNEEGSTWGHWQCAADGGIAGTAMMSEDSTPPPVVDVEISLGAEAADEPEIAGARADHPYFRLGSQYDASLKDIVVLMVSSKSQTGTSTGLSNRAASYFSYAATLGDVYERQLGLRFLLQELILIPSDSSEPDIESPTIATDSAGQQLGYVRNWAATHRPQGTYEWGHLMGWTNVDGAGGGTVGWAYINAYGSDVYGISVNERAWTWGVIVHELGHNVGANHTSGGAMNPSVSKSNPQEGFFTQNNTSGGGFTAAKEIYDYMSNLSRTFVFGPAPLRNPNEMPFGVDDAVATPVDTPVSFNPLANDLAATPLFGQTNTALSLVEVGQVFPKAAGTASLFGNEIIFTPASGFTGNVWLSYTLRGDLGNGGTGWMHSADVVVTVGGISSDPNLNPALSATDDVVEAALTGDIRVNPLLNDEGKGRLWAGAVDAVSSVSGSAQSYSEAAFRLVGATVINGNGTVALETAQMTRDSSNVQDNTGYLVYTPGSGEPDQIVIEYTVADANGNQTTSFVYINRVDPREIEATGTIIGTTGSYGGGTNTRDKVFDKDLLTFFDADISSGAWAGLDLGSVKQIARIKYAPRSGQEVRMVGGQFQGSNSADFSGGVVTLYTVPSSPQPGVLSEVAVNDTGSYRYLRYIGPNDGWCNVAEVEFHTEAAPAAATGLVATVGPDGDVSLDWNANSEIDLASYNVYRGTTPGTYGDPPVNVASNNHIDTTAVNGTTYYYVVTAVDAEGYESTKSNQVSATPSVNQFGPVVNVGPDQSAVFSGSAPWTPAALTTAGWYDASDAATITQSSDSVSQWADKSGNGLHLTQASATLQPRTGINTIGGLPAIKFDGSDDTLVTAGNPFAPTIGDAFVIAVHRIDTTASGTLFTLSGSATNASRWQAHAPFSGTVYFDTGGTGGGNRVSTSYGVTAGDDVLVGFYGSTTDNVQQIFKNGALLKGDATGHGVGTVANIFVGSSANTQYQNTSIGEFMMINGTVTTENRQNLEGYLAHKWGLTASLPAEHPYKSLAPGGAGVIVDLEGTVSDPDGTTPTTLWTMVSGPGPVTFGNANAASTTATFTEPGIYVLRLTASDGFYSTFEEVTVTITQEGGGFGVEYAGNGNTGGSVPEDGDSPYQSDATVTVLGNSGSLTRLGYSFNGWNTAADGLGISYAPGATFVISAATTLHAQWTANVYTITFDKQGGDGGSGSTSATFDSPMPVATAPTRSDHTFLGYFSEPAGAGVSYYDASMSGQGNWLIDGNAILYAHWLADPIVTAGANQNATLGALGLWSPAGISTAAWYDATDATSITHSGGSVSQWSDKSGNNNHAAQATSTERPTTGTVYLGGLNAIAFRIGDGTNKQFLSAPDQASLNLDSSGGANVFAVMRYFEYVNQGSGLNAALGKGPLLSSSSAYGVRIGSTSTLGYKAAFNGDVSTTAYTGQEILLSGTGDNASKTARVFINGELRDTATTTEAFTSDNTSPLQIGRDINANRQSNVDFGEIIVIGSVISTAEREMIEGYLAHKWNQVDGLPANHAYKAQAPAASGVIVNLDGNVTVPEGSTITSLWTLQSGPGNVTFEDASAVDTTATFTEAGTYVLRLTADNGITQTFGEITITVLSDGQTPPAAPTGFAATAGESSIVLDWDSHPDPAVASYSVYRSQGPGGSGFVAIATGLTGTAYTDETAVNDVTYLYRLTAVGTEGLESLSGADVSATAEGPPLVSEGPDGLIYQTYANEGQYTKVNTVPDFSRAGYQGGGVAIPFVPAAVTLTPSGGDDKAAIQNAINTVSALPLVDGFRGAVVLGAGDYTVSGTLNLNASGVVIRGAGQQDGGGTRITYTATTQSDLFHFHGSGGPAVVAGTARDISDLHAPVGSGTLNLTDASPFAPGDFIRISNLMNQKWIDDIGMTEGGGLAGAPGDPAWNASDFQLRHHRYVVAVNGNEITLDAPLVQAVETQYGGGRVEKLTYTGAIENVGIENIRLQSAYAGDEDEAHGWEAIEMRRVNNGWVRQVTSRYFGMGLVLIDDSSQFVTVEDSACLDPKSITTGGRKYSFHIDDSTYNLVQRCLTRGGRHDFVSGSVTPGPNVFVDSMATQAFSDIGPHFRYATGELYDNIKSDNDINVQNRLNAGTSHGWAGAQIMFWNAEASSIRSDAPTGAMNWSIGTTGTKASGHSFMAPWEPFGIWQSHNVPVAPRSLYLAQLADRLGNAALRKIALPDQKSGRIWTQLEAWGGDGLFLAPVVCWIDDSAPAEVLDPTDISAWIRDLGVQDNVASTTWSKVSGPGVVTFGDHTAPDTTVGFSLPGTYEMQFTAEDGSRQVSGSITVEVTDPNGLGVPSAPTGLAATPGGGVIGLTWNANPEDVNISYNVYRSETPGVYGVAVASALNGTDYTDTTPVNDVTYYYVVTAVIAATDESSLSNEVSVTITDSDDDGIADVWEMQYFSGLLIDGGADSDGDGVLDFFEYLYGSDPTDADDIGLLVSAVPKQNGDGIAFRWEILPQFVLGNHYDVRILSDLVRWDPISVEHFSMETTPAGDRNRIELSRDDDYGNRIFMKLVKP